MEVGLVGIAIWDWLDAFAASTKEIPSLTVLDTIVF